MKRKQALILIGEMCKEHRENIGMKQSQIAEHVGYSEQNISSFETGRTNNLLIFLYYIMTGMLDDASNRFMIAHILEGLKNGD